MNENLTQPMTMTITDRPVHERRDFKYVVTGGSLLAFCAGFLNIVSILYTGFTVSHNTGIFTNMSSQFARAKFSAALFKLGILTAYLLGSASVGFFISKTKFHYSRFYGFFFIAEAILFFLVIQLYDNKHMNMSVILSSLSMGLQNGLFTNFSGAVVRTTHVTGLITDVGLIIGHWLRGKEETKDLWKLKVLFPLMIGFFIGAFIGTISFDMYSIHALYIPTTILGVGGTAWTILRLKYKFKMDKKTNTFEIQS